MLAPPYLGMDLKMVAQEIIMIKIVVTTHVLRLEKISKI